MRYKVELCIPTSYADDCQRGFYVFECTNLQKACEFAEREAANIKVQGGLMQVVRPSDATIIMSFDCAN